MGRLESRRVGGNSARLEMDSACDVYDYMLVACILLFLFECERERYDCAHERSDR